MRHFTFDGISSQDLGVSIVELDSGLKQEPLFPTRSIVETVIPNKDKPFFKRIESDPLSFPLTIHINEWRERDNLRQVANWLYQPYYKELYFEDNPERIYYAIFYEDTQLFHNGAKDGYITLNARCDSPYSYSRPVNLNNVTGSTVIYNQGDKMIKPKVWIKTVDSNISIVNHATIQTVTFTGLNKNEEIYIDFENEDIVSNHQDVGVYRYDNHNNTWLEFPVGENRLELIGDFTLDIEYQQIYLAD